ncbi:DUF2971 domain-containing protein [Vibrio fluvialis]|nr:DUF2971 domain-containing protein [Vibrio fluvialis]
MAEQNISFVEEPEQYLFRYRACNENTLSEIITADIWHSKIQQLNDPFELNFIFDWDEFSISNFPKINNVLKVFPDKELTQAYIVNQQEQLFSSLRNAIESQIEELNRKLEQTGVCCFSQSPDNAMMWSHYADGMKGLCLVYDLESVKKQEQFDNLKPISYQDRIEKISYKNLSARVKQRPDDQRYQFTSDSNPKLVNIKGYDFSIKLEDHSTIYKKHSRWSQEKEIRNVLWAETDEELSQSGFFENIGLGSLKAIVIGEKMAKSQRKLLEVLCKQRNIDIYIAEVVRETLSVGIRPYIQLIQ